MDVASVTKVEYLTEEKYFVDPDGKGPITFGTEKKVKFDDTEAVGLDEEPRLAADGILDGQGGQVPELQGYITAIVSEDEICSA